MSRETECKNCDNDLVIKPGESREGFSRRIYCDDRCRWQFWNEKGKSLDDIPIDTPDWFDWVACWRALNNKPVGRALTRREKAFIEKVRSGEEKEIKIDLESVIGS